MCTARLSIHYLLSIESVPEAYRILETVLTMNKHFASCYSDHILVFHRVTSDHYILETMAESELDALKANSEFWATNGINKSSKAFGKIRIG